MNTESILNLYTHKSIKVTKCGIKEYDQVLRTLRRGKIVASIYQDVTSGQKPKVREIDIDVNNIENILTKYNTITVIKTRLPPLSVIFYALMKARTQFGNTDIIYACSDRKTRLTENKVLVGYTPHYFIEYWTTKNSRLDKMFNIKDTTCPLNAVLKSYKTSDSNYLLSKHEFDEYVPYIISNLKDDDDIDQNTLLDLCRYMRLKKGIVVFSLPQYNGNTRIFVNTLKFIKALGI